jgi:prepilin-type processing-associated H-X9-DG protein
MVLTARKTGNSKQRGFTVLELICILAVIAFLFALLMPSLSKVKRISTRVVCGSNMRAYGLIGTLYLEDSDGRFPDPQNWLYAAASDTPQHPVGCRWHDWPMSLHGELMGETAAYRGMMWEYTSEMAKATCPEFRDFAGDRGCENPDHNPAIDLKPQFNYTMNAYLGAAIEGGVVTLDAVDRPAGKFFFAEENAWSVRPDHPQYPVGWLTAPLSTKALDDTALLIAPTPGAENCFGTFHGASGDLSDGSGNLAYLDGHVGMISVEEQLRSVMHEKSQFRGSSLRSVSYDPAGNLAPAWVSKDPPPGGWDGQ